MSSTRFKTLRERSVRLPAPQLIAWAALALFAYSGPSYAAEKKPELTRVQLLGLRGNRLERVHRCPGTMPGQHHPKIRICEEAVTGKGEVIRESVAVAAEKDWFPQKEFGEMQVAEIRFVDPGKLRDKKGQGIRSLLVAPNENEVYTSPRVRVEIDAALTPEQVRQELMAIRAPLLKLIEERKKALGSKSTQVLADCQSKDAKSKSSCSAWEQITTAYANQAYLKLLTGFSSKTPTQYCGSWVQKGLDSSLAGARLPPGAGPAKTDNSAAGDLLGGLEQIRNSPQYAEVSEITRLQQEQAERDAQAQIQFYTKQLDSLADSYKTRQKYSHLDYNSICDAAATAHLQEQLGKFEPQYNALPRGGSRTVQQEVDELALKLQVTGLKAQLDYCRNPMPAPAPDYPTYVGGQGGAVRGHGYGRHAVAPSPQESSVSSTQSSGFGSASFNSWAAPLDSQ